MDAHLPCSNGSEFPFNMQVWANVDHIVIFFLFPLVMGKEEWEKSEVFITIFC